MTSQTRVERVEECLHEASDLCAVPDSTDAQQLAIKFTLSMHKKNNFTRNDVQDVQNATREFCSGILNKIEDLDLNIDDLQLQHQFNTLLKTSKTAFDFINTEDKFFNHLKSLGIF